MFLASMSPSGCRITSRLELAPWIITTGGPAASRGPISRTLRLAPGNLDHPALRGIGALQRQGHRPA